MTTNIESLPLLQANIGVGSDEDLVIALGFTMADGVTPLSLAGISFTAAVTSLLTGTTIAILSSEGGEIVVSGGSSNLLTITELAAAKAAWAVGAYALSLTASDGTFTKDVFVSSSVIVGAPSPLSVTIVRAAGVAAVSAASPAAAGRARRSPGGRGGLSRGASHDRARVGRPALDQRRRPPGVMMNRFLLALILIFGVSGAMAQTLGNPTFNSLTLINPLSGAGVAFTPPGQPPETLQARGLFQSFVGDFGASGSNETTAGAIAAGRTRFSLAAPQDFANARACSFPAPARISPQRSRARRQWSSGRPGRPRSITTWRASTARAASAFPCRRPSRRGGDAHRAELQLDRHHAGQRRDRLRGMERLRRNRAVDLYRLRAIGDL